MIHFAPPLCRLAEMAVLCALQYTLCYLVLPQHRPPSPFFTCGLPRKHQTSGKCQDVPAVLSLSLRDTAVFILGLEAPSVTLT